jgi:hypothetical protein
MVGNADGSSRVFRSFLYVPDYCVAVNRDASSTWALVFFTPHLHIFPVSHRMLCFLFNLSLCGLMWHLVPVSG